MTTVAGVKILLINRKLDGLSDEAFHDYWKNVHAALVKRTPILTNTIKRYVQVRRLMRVYSIFVSRIDVDGKKDP